ncbi:MAG: HAMP domain-containing histidine kinase [Clostridia bacterium]|nr:HAMP domain-containing histidine kinase [Clostridia bacterium]
MKKPINGKSLRFRINLWYTILMCVLSVALITCVVAAARTAAQSEAQQNLIRSVERNLDEIEVENGILDIESDFAFINGNVYALVFSENGRLLGGTYPEGISFEEPLREGRSDIVDGYYIYDSHIEFSKYEYKIHGVTGEIISSECDGIDSYTPYEGNLNGVGEDCLLSYSQAYEIALEHSNLTGEKTDLIVARSYEYNDEPIYEIEFYCEKKGYEDIWVRGVARATGIDGVWGAVVKIATVLIPLVILLAAAVGGLIAKKAMLPVKQLSEAVSETRSGTDLTRHITVSDSDPALVTLADNFNAMFERLRQSFETERQFTSDVSHELRTPIAVILAECDYQLARNDLSEEDREGIETVRKQANSMKQIVSQLLYFARMEQGKEKPEFENEDLSELVSAVCDDMSSLAEGSVTIEKNIQSNIEMKLDVAMMTRLVTNLVSNAVTYGRENGHVIVSLEKSRDTVRLSVADDGIGIAKEHLEKIWQRFYRVDKARSRESGCSGLGLPMVKQIAVIHGGTVSVKSEEGKGSEFTVEFRSEESF